MEALTAHPREELRAPTRHVAALDVRAVTKVFGPGPVTRLVKRGRADRPYRAAHTFEEARDILLAQRGSQLDPCMVDALIRELRP